MSGNSVLKDDSDVGNVDAAVIISFEGACSSMLVLGRKSAIARSSDKSIFTSAVVARLLPSPIVFRGGVDIVDAEAEVISESAVLEVSVFLVSSCPPS